MNKMDLDYINTVMIQKILNEGVPAIKTATVEVEWKPKAVDPITVETWVGGKLETVNVANPDDYILTNPGGERYVITVGDFIRSYEFISHDEYVRFIEYGTGTARKKSVTHILQCDVSGTIETDWGTMETSSGGYYATDGKSMWFIDEQKFNETYELLY